MNTEEITLTDGTTYTIRTRLGWLEQQRIEDNALRLFADGKAIAAMESIEDLPEIEIRVDRAARDLARLSARLAGVKRQDILGLPAGHVAALLARITELEAEAAAEVESVQPGNPTTMLSKKLSET